MQKVIINAAITKDVPHVFFECPMKPISVEKELALELLNALIQLPVRVHLPPTDSFYTPRYYYVYFTRPFVKIIDIIGVKKDCTPTKWGYKLGYWHPQIQQRLVESVKIYLRNHGNGRA